ncbi:hypothetical protein NKH18_22110 [Streptomyces sp. M10(2022)]
MNAERPRSCPPARLVQGHHRRRGCQRRHRQGGVVTDEQNVRPHRDRRHHMPLIRMCGVPEPLELAPCTAHLRALRETGSPEDLLRVLSFTTATQ